MGTNGTRTGDVAIEVASISDRFPQSEGTTTFTVAAVNDIDVNEFSVFFISHSRQDHTLFDVQVEISLSPGLSFAANQQAPSSGTFDTSTGIWNVGTMAARRIGHPSLQVAVDLTNDSLADLPLQQRCLTARVVQAVPGFASHPLKRANDTFTACLGGFLLTQGDEVVLFYPYDCVGDADFPCTDMDTVEMLANAFRPGSSELHTGWLQPESIVVQVHPDTGRLFDVSRHSVHPTGLASWQTARAGGRIPVEGVKIGYTRAGFNDNLANWSSLVRTVTVSGLDGGTAPGRGQDSLRQQNSERLVRSESYGR